MVEVEVGRSTGRDLPAVGLRLPRGWRALGETQLDRLIEMRPAHFGVHLDLAGAGWSRTLSRASELAIATATGLELAIRPSRHPVAALEALASAIPLAQGKVSRFIVDARGPNSAEVVSRARELLQSTAPRASFATTARRAPDGVDLARRFQAPPRPRRDYLSGALSALAVSAPRTEARVVSPFEAPLVSSLGARPAGATFAVASLALLGRSGVRSVTFAAEPGLGVLRRRRGHDIVAGAYHVFADFGEWDFGQVGDARSHDPGRVEALCAHTVDGPRVLLANLQARPVGIRVRPLPSRVRLRVLDAETSAWACEEPERFRASSRSRRTRRGELDVPLGPLAVARIDC